MLINAPSLQQANHAADKFSKIQKRHLLQIFTKLNRIQLRQDSITKTNKPCETGIRRYGLNSRLSGTNSVVLRPHAGTAAAEDTGEARRTAAKA